MTKTLDIGEARRYKSLIAELIQFASRGQCVDKENGYSLVDGMKRTPERFLKALYEEWCSGYDITEEMIGTMLTQFDGEGYDELIMLDGIEFHSLCEHHLAPFSGTACIAYIPGGKIAGISKLARVLDAYAKRFQNQERITMQVTTALDTHLRTKGSACFLKAKHSCVCSRGVGKQGSKMKTMSLTGVFRDEVSARAELMRMIGV